jgi:biopolymer transport protein ExbD
VEPPTSNTSVAASPDATVTITSDVRYLVDGRPVNGLTGVRFALRGKLAGVSEPTVLVQIDKSLDVQKLFDIYNISRDLKFRIAVSTKSE